MAKSISVAVVGVGRMGGYHVNVLSQLKDVHFLGIFDTDTKRSAEIAQRYDCKNYQKLSTLFQEAEAVVIATPTSTHYEIACLAMEEGVHVLVEKPIANTLADARHLCELAEKRNLKLFVGHVERYNGAVQELKKIIKKPYSWESRRVSFGAKRIVDTGVALDLLIHDIDICFRTMGSRVVSLKALGVFTKSQENEEVANAQILFENACVGSFFASRLSHVKERSLMVMDEECTFVLDFTTQNISIHRAGASDITTQPKEIRYSQQASIEKLYIHKQNPLQLELEDFIASIRNNMYVDNEADLLTLGTTLAIVEDLKANAINRGKASG